MKPGSYNSSRSAYFIIKFGANLVPASVDSLYIPLSVPKVEITREGNKKITELLTGYTVAMATCHLRTILSFNYFNDSVKKNLWWNTIIRCVHHGSSVFQLKISILTLSRVQRHGNSLESLEERMVCPN